MRLECNWLLLLLLFFVQYKKYTLNIEAGHKALAPKLTLQRQRPEGVLAAGTGIIGPSVLLRLINTFFFLTEADLL